MKLKIKKHVVFNGRFLKPGEVHDLEENEHGHVQGLIDKELASEHKGDGRKEQVNQNQYDSPSAQLKRMKRPELLKAVEAFNAEHPDKQLSVAGNESNDSIIAKLLGAAGYATDSDNT